MSKIKITINDWINYKKNVGVGILTIHGLLGWGKTAMANTLVLECFAKGESWVMPGDVFCEWRHFLLYQKLVNEVTLLVPKELEIKYHPENMINGNFLRKEIDYEKLDIMAYFPEDNKTRLIVIFDEHLKVEQRAWLWTNITSQLIVRSIHLDHCIGMLFNEAGILFPQHASGNLWNAVMAFSELIVRVRKGLVRLILISQLPNEIFDTIRKKALFRIYRKGSALRSERKKIRDATPFLARNEYALIVGGLYNKYNIVDKFHEYKTKWLMIPKVIPIY